MENTTKYNKFDFIFSYYDSITKWLYNDKNVGWINQILGFENCGTKDTWESWNIHMQIKK